MTETIAGTVQKRYEYDTRDQLKKVFAGNTTEIAKFDYDFSRRRTSKQTANTNLHYVYAGDEVIDEFDSSSALLPLQNRYELGAGEVVKGELRNEPTNYYFSDALGSTTNLSQITGTQSASTSVSEYDSFGKVNLQTGASANSIGYTGQRLDTETGLMALGNGERYYSPALARFTQQDSFVGKSVMPQSLNRYSYAVNNPHRYTDPTGNYLESAIDVASLGIGIYSFQDNARQGNYLSAGLDAVGIVADVIALALPVVPGVAGLTIKGIRATAAIKAVQIADRTINTVQASVAAGESFGQGDVKWGLINTGLALLGGKGVQSSLGGFSRATGGQGSGLEQLEKIEELTKGSAKAQRIVEDAGELGAKPKRTVNELIAATEQRIADVRSKYGLNEASDRVNFDDGGGLYRANLMDGGKPQFRSNIDEVENALWRKVELGKEFQGGRRVYQRDDIFDPYHKSQWTVDGKIKQGTNIERMKTGRAPIGVDDEPVELHHVIQREINKMTGTRGPLAEVLESWHGRSDIYSVLHFPKPKLPKISSWRKIDKDIRSPLDSEFESFKKMYWKRRSQDFE